MLPFALLATITHAQSHDLDVLLVTEDFSADFASTNYTITLEVRTVTSIDSIDFVDNGGAVLPMSEYVQGVFSLGLDPTESLESHLTRDRANESFELRITPIGAPTSTYRFDLSDVLGPQIDPLSLPGSGQGIGYNAKPIPEIAWDPPKNVGDFLLIELGNHIAAHSPIPFFPEIIGLDDPTLLGSESSYTLGSKDPGAFEARVIYGSKLGDFAPTLLSGDPLDLGSAGAIYTISTDMLIVEGCLSDITGDGEFDFFDVSFMLQNQIDYNGDTAFDFFDISMILQDGQAFCP